MNKLFALYILVLCSLGLVACGDDKSSSSDSSKGSVVEVDGLEDRVHCTKSHYGEIVHVLENDSIYECTSDGWVVADSEKIEEILVGSSSSKGEEPDEAGNDSEKSSSSAIVPSSSDTAEIEVKRVDSVSVSGFAHKGPFISGTAVTVYELDSVLATTKRKYSSKISGDDGSFSVKGIALERQFALVEVNGFYRNAVTGKNTSGTKLKLHAIEDLSTGKDVEVNVNVFTELEYERVKNLVQKNKYNVPAAKLRATQELLSIFGATGDDTLKATAISLKDTNSAGVALYAASVMLQGSLSVSKFSARLAAVAEDFAADGKLNNWEFRAAMADELSERENFDDIRANIKAMKITAKVPTFEHILENFWYDEFKLGICNDSTELTVVKNSNKYSDTYGKGYACTSKRWHLVSDQDTEFGLCVADSNGVYKTAKSKLHYVCSDGSWKEVSEIIFELNHRTPCDNSREGKAIKADADGSYYACAAGVWKEITELENELLYENPCNEGNNEKVIKASTNGKFYACLDMEWEDALELDYKIGYACTEGNSQKFETVDGENYACYEKKWIAVSDVDKGIGYLCKENAIGNREKFDGKFYRCDGTKWNEISEDMFEIGLCTEKFVGGCEIGVSGKYYECQDNGEFEWIESNEIYCELGVCDLSNEGSLPIYKGNGYACVNKEWKQCSSENVNEISGSLACVDSVDTNEEQAYAWRNANAMEMATGMVCGNHNKAMSSNDWVNVESGTYYCVDECDKMMCSEGIHDYRWEIASEVEIATQLICDESTAGIVKNNYACKWSWEDHENVWVEASEVEKKMGKTCNGSIVSSVEMSLDKSAYYVCDDGMDGYQWRFADLFEQKIKDVCGSSKKNKTVTVGGESYVCRSNTDGSRYFWTLKVSDVRSLAKKTSYEAVAIGDQIWFNSNLNYNSTYATYDPDDPNGSTYGAYYRHDGRNSVCPSGWKTPSKSDVEKLIAFLDENAIDAVSALTDSSFYPDEYKNEYGSNDYGFGGIGASVINYCTEELKQKASWLCGEERRNGYANWFWTSESGSSCSNAFVIQKSYGKGKIDFVCIENEAVTKTSGGSFQVTSMPRKIPVRCLKN